MARYFFDTSAIVKYYHQERGSAAVAKVFAEPDCHVSISNLGFLEIHSALAIKVRSAVLDSQSASVLYTRLRQDVATADIQVLPLLAHHFTIAEVLLLRHSFHHRLRTLDALQLAMALDLYRQQLLDSFIVADDALAEIARLEQLTVFNPQSHP